MLPGRGRAKIITAKEVNAGEELKKIKMNEQEMIQSARNGSVESFNQIVIRYQDLVYRQAYYMLHDHARAEDITQESFIRAYNSLSKYRGGSFRAWLLRIATNACLDELRQQKRRKMFPFSFLSSADDTKDAEEYLPDGNRSVEEQVERSELYRLLQKHLEQLDPKYQAVITLMDMQGISYEEAAQVLRIPMGTLKSRLVRARRQLCLSLDRVPEMRLIAGYA
jgi:RNA polymerase sigma-70 factor, ECF subfamily